VYRFEVKVDRSYRAMARLGRAPGVGTFTGLWHLARNNIMMSDICPEVDDLLAYLPWLRGDVLVTGLGLGMTLHILTTVPAYSRHVRSITVIEKDRDVIKLVAKHHRDPRIEVIHADAFHWRPPHGVRYDVAWHDIWQRIRTGNIDGMQRLRRHYQHAVTGRQLFWSQAILASRGRDTRHLVTRIPDGERRIDGA